MKQVFKKLNQKQRDIIIKLKSIGSLKKIKILKQNIIVASY
jgi:hypothetical protein